MGNLYQILRCAVLTTLSVVMLSCAKDSTEAPTPPAAHEDEGINKEMDALLRTHYLWNEEYVTLKPNYAQAYNTFLPSLLRNQMITNILDRKYYGKDEAGKDIYKIYSFVQRSSLVSVTQSTRGVNHDQKKEAALSFGITNIISAELEANPSHFLFVVGAVYPDSPAAAAGIKRGFTIEEVDGVAITKENLVNLYYMISQPEAVESIKLKDYDTGLIATLTAKSMYANPVLKSTVISQGAKKVGYIAYEGFDAAYDDELLAAIKTLKDDGANELILDLRYNGGGHVISSNMLSSCIAGAACSGKIYQYYKYNAARMANPPKTATETGNKYDSSKRFFYENFRYGDYYGVDLRNYALNMSRVFVLVGSGTASASEAVINGLKGIGIPVTLIGERTNGKNVGMEVFSLKDARYEYTFYPISFQCFNANEVSVDPQGIKPDYKVYEWNNGVVDFAEATEPLFAKAMSLITGVAPAAMKPRADLGLQFVGGAFPSTNPSRQGMLQLPPAER